MNQQKITTKKCNYKKKKQLATKITSDEFSIRNSIIDHSQLRTLQKSCISSDFFQKLSNGNGCYRIQSKDTL